MSSQASPLTFDPDEILGRFDPGGRLSPFYDILRVENEKVNLVSRETIAEGLETLAAESLFPLDQIGLARIGNYLDIGAGGGFPAIPILMCREAEKAVLLERTSKKFLALRRILRALDIDANRVSVYDESFEQAALAYPFDLITMRLVKLTDKIIRKVNDLLVPGGCFVYYSQPPDALKADFINRSVFSYKSANGISFKHFTIFKKSS